MKKRWNIAKKAAVAVIGAGLAACSLIDDDLSGCSKDYEVNYEMRLVTNMTTELQTQLSTQLDNDVADALRSYLQNIFTDFAHDVDLSFYDTEGDSVRLYHDQHVMDANQASYTLYLPIRDYMHLAAANLVNNRQVSLWADDYCHTSKLQQSVTQGDTITPHTTGLFTARQPMALKDEAEQTIYVRLYMVNCAAALVIDPRGHDYRKIQVYNAGFATGFNINDSTFTFAPSSPIVKADAIEVENSDKLCFCSVNFPSREPSTAQSRTIGGTTRTVIETTEPFASQPGKESLWTYLVYVTNTDGTVTKTILHLSQPLRAGQLKILNAWISDNGAISTEVKEVSTSVTLKWKEGLEINS